MNPPRIPNPEAAAREGKHKDQYLWEYIRSLKQELERVKSATTRIPKR